MPRHFSDWLTAYCDYASFSEAPRRMHFFAGVSAIAGALRRHVWISMAYFKWFPNHYIIFVAPPGIVSKSTTTAIAMDLLRKVPGVKFGPDVVTWPALVSAFAGSAEQFEIGSEFYTQCALTLESSEFGNLVNPADRDMIDLLVTLWDAKTGAFQKQTKGSGNDLVENPWINLIACTTPAWIAGNFPEYLIGGGFTSRCLFVYADTKEKLVAYPYLEVPSDLSNTGEKLAADLEHIATALCGPYRLDSELITWGKEWYRAHNSGKPSGLEDDRFGGYLARKQTHMHKLAMIIAASQRDELIITAEDLQLANIMITDLEEALPKVFSKIGKSPQSIQVDRFVRMVQSQRVVPYEEAYRWVYTQFPDPRAAQAVIEGAVKAGFIRLGNVDGKPVWLAVDII